MASPTILVEIHYRRRWDALPTYARGELTYATLAGRAGLPVVVLTGETYRADDGRLAGELVDPQHCPPLRLVRALSDADKPLWLAALAQGYREQTTYDLSPW